MDAANFIYHTPHGPIYGLIGNTGLRRLVLPDPEHPLHPYILHSRPNHLLGRRLHMLLEQYFAGVVTVFSEISLELDDATPFQRRVWRATASIPYGRTVAYGELAGIIGLKKAARAVGQALKRNPVPIVIPCHRVVSASGVPGGFSAPAFWKTLLLELERSACRVESD